MEAYLQSLASDLSFNPRPIHRILIANNGCAAIKFILSLQEWSTMHLNTPVFEFVAMATIDDMDANYAYIQQADYVVEVPSGPAASNYCNVQLIAKIAKERKCDAVWPGWGFASEWPSLPRALEGVCAFIGPPASAMDALGDKVMATILAQTAGVPCVEWSGNNLKLTDDQIRDFKASGALPDALVDECSVASGEAALSVCQSMGYPCMIKAAEGGGGKGIRKVNGDDEVKQAFITVRGEIAQGRIFVMRCVNMCRHIEIQVLGDQYGQAIALSGRDCTVQRRNQKVIEEGPPPIPQEVLEGLEASAVRLCQLVGYQSAGTVEFMYSESEKRAFFLEVNTRLQVEHPVTEFLCQVNLPANMALIAMGVPLSSLQDIQAFKRDRFSREPQHVMAVRIIAEDTEKNFQPTVGDVHHLNFRAPPDVWGYFAIGSCGKIHQFSDSQFGHIFARGKTREICIKRQQMALESLHIRGEIRTNSEFLITLLNDSDFRKDDLTTCWIQRRFSSFVTSQKEEILEPAAFAAAFRAANRFLTNENAFELNLERGQRLVNLGSTFTEEFVYGSGDSLLKFTFCCEVVGPNQMVIRLADNGRRTSSPGGSKADRKSMRVLYRVMNHTLLLTLLDYGSRFVPAFCMEEEDIGALRVTVYGKTYTFQPDHDPSLLTSPCDGVLVRYLVPNNTYVEAGQSYVEITSMKLYMNLHTEVSGTLVHASSASASFSRGALLANIILDNSQKMVQPSRFKGSFSKDMPEVSGFELYTTAKFDILSAEKGYFTREAENDAHMDFFYSICKNHLEEIYEAQVVLIRNENGVETDLKIQKLSEKKIDFGYHYLLIDLAIEGLESFLRSADLFASLDNKIFEYPDFLSNLRASSDASEIVQLFRQRQNPSQRQALVNGMVNWVEAFLLKFEHSAYHRTLINLLCRLSNRPLYPCLRCRLLLMSLSEKYVLETEENRLPVNEIQGLGPMELPTNMNLPQVMDVIRHGDWLLICQAFEELLCTLYQVPRKELIEGSRESHGPCFRKIRHERLYLADLTPIDLPDAKEELPYLSHRWWSRHSYWSSAGRLRSNALSQDFLDKQEEQVSLAVLLQEGTWLEHLENALTTYESSDLDLLFLQFNGTWEFEVGLQTLIPQLERFTLISISNTEATFHYSCENGELRELETLRSLSVIEIPYYELERLRDFELQTLAEDLSHNTKLKLYKGSSSSMARLFSRCVINKLRVKSALSTSSEESQRSVLAYQSLGSPVLMEVEDALLKSLSLLQTHRGSHICHHVLLSVVEPLVCVEDSQEGLHFHDLVEAIRTTCCRHELFLQKVDCREVEFRFHVFFQGSQDGDCFGVRLVSDNPTRQFRRLRHYIEFFDPTTGGIVFSKMQASSFNSSKALSDAMDHQSDVENDEYDLRSVHASHPTYSSLDLKRASTARLDTVYCYDILDLIRSCLKEKWVQCRSSQIHHRLITQEESPTYMDAVELVYNAKTGLLETIHREPGLNTCGMVAWKLRLATPEYPNGRQIILVANDVTFQIGSFGIDEDNLYKAVVDLARQDRIPVFSYACNSGARIGLANEVQQKFRIMWNNPETPELGFQYIYLEAEDYEAIQNSVICQPIDHPDMGRIYRITDIIGAKHGIGVENLAASGFIAAVTSEAYKEIPTFTFVSGRTVGIGAYITRLSQRVIQKRGSSILLTGFRALNKVLGRPAYSDNQEIGGVNIMGRNGVSHLIVDSDKEGVARFLQWLAFIPETRGGTLPVMLSDDVVTRPIKYMPQVSNDARLMIIGQSGPRGEFLGGLFDKHTFVEVQEEWARSVIVGRARLGGIPVGVILVETNATECIFPADPADLSAQERRTNKAGCVWYADSAFKTAQAIRDINNEGLPLMILANWRGFAGGQTEMFSEILKYGSYIVDNLVDFQNPVFVYLPPNSELRGGAWVVMDSRINPDVMEMYADPTARGGILEPAGIVQVKFREASLKDCAHRNDQDIKDLLALSQSDPKMVDDRLETRYQEIRDAYNPVALHFADLHDTPVRMFKKEVINGIVPWEEARTFFYWRLRRQLVLWNLRSEIIHLKPTFSVSQATRLVEDWFHRSQHSKQAGDSVYLQSRAFLCWAGEGNIADRIKAELAD